jgi:uncharacterized protein (TIRG00374 family)
MAKKVVRRLFKIIIQLIVLSICGVFVYNHAEDFSVFFTLPVPHVLTLLSISFISLLPVAFEFNYSLQLFNLKLKLKEWFGLSIVNSFYNIFLPFSSGIFIRGVYLKKKYSFDFSKYSGLMGISLLLNLIIGALLALVLAMSVSHSVDLDIIKLISFGLVGLIVFLLLLYFLSKKLATIDFKISFINTFLASIESGINLLLENKSLILPLILSQLAMNVLLGIRLFLCFYFLDLEVSFLSVILVQALTMFTTIINITPGNIGLREGVIGSLQVLLGVSFEESVLAATLDRVFSTITVLLLGLFFNYKLLK